MYVGTFVTDNNISCGTCNNKRTMDVNPESNVTRRSISPRRSAAIENNKHLRKKNVPNKSKYKQIIK